MRIRRVFQIDGGRVKPYFVAARSWLGRLRRFQGHLSAPRRRLGRVHFLNALIVGSQLLMPLAVGRLVDRLSRQADVVSVIPAALGALGLMLLANVLSTGVQMWTSKEAIACAMEMRTRMLEVVYGRFTPGSRGPTVSDLHARFGADVGMIGQLWPVGIALLVRHLLFLVLAAAVLLYISVPLTLGVAAFLPLAVVVFGWFSRRLTRLVAQAQASASVTNGVLLESLASAPLARPSGADDFHHRRMLGALADSGDKLHRARRWSLGLALVLGLLPLAVSFGVWTFGASRVHAGAMSAGDLVAFAVALSVLYAPLTGLLSAASGVVYESVAMDRILAVLEGGGELDRWGRLPTGLLLLGPGAKVIELRGFQFAYEGRVLFDHFDCLVPKGEFALLRGRNGTGKSTLLNLIFNAHGPHGSRIFIDGTPVAQVEAQSYARLVGYLPQDILIYSDTLRNNIVMGRAIDDRTIYAVASELGLVGFLDAWPGGLDGAVAESGRNLSGGQKQRVGLLRALVGGPSIVLLDEPEKNLDRATLSALVSYLARRKGQCTCLAATHADAFDALAGLCIDLPDGPEGPEGRADDRAQ